MEPIDYMGALRRSWRLFLALAVVGAVVAVLLPVSHNPKAKTNALPGYKWQSSLEVGASPSSPASALGGGITNAQIQFYAGSSEVRSNTIDAAGISVPPYLQNQVLSVKQAAKPTKKNRQAGPVMLVAESDTARGAVLLVLEYSKQLGSVLVDLASQHQKANATGPVTTDSIGYQVLQAGPLAPITHKGGGKTSITSSRKVRLGIGIVVGLLLAAAIVLTRELLEKRIRNSERAESTFEYPVVAEIPGTSRSKGSPAYDLEVVEDPESVAAEAYRMLRMSVLFEALAPRIAPGNSADPILSGYGLLAPPPGTGNGAGSTGAVRNESTGSTAEQIGRRQVVLVVSAGNEASRPQVAANFAAVYAEAGQRAVVISTADLGTGRHAVATGTITGEVGVGDVESRLEPSRIDGVFRLPLSDFVENSGQLVTRAPAVIEATRSVADVVVVEAPPLLAVHHAEALSHAVDVVLVVGECWSTTFSDARRAGDLLRRMEAPVLGVVLTNVPISRRDARERQSAVPGQPTVVTDLSDGEPAAGTETRTPADAVTQTQA